MALQAVYKQFLAAPNSSALAANASLHYITTTTSYNGATDIIKHLNTLRNQVKKKKEDILFAIEGQNAAAIEIDTTLEFVTSGGAYLPGLDDNFVTDRTVYLPITHTVSFDGEGKIAQIRQSWDQGSLLKQLEVIGRTGRNWPIRDSKEQISLIVRAAKAAGAVPVGASNNNNDEVVIRSRGNSTNILRDPHASLALFAPREEAENNLPAPVVSPYAGSRRPRQRDFAEILGDEPVEDLATPSRARSQSPSKAVAPKSGAGKNFQPSRLFDEAAEEEAAAAAANDETFKSPERVIKPNPHKYKHFDFADGSEPADAPKAGKDWDARPKSKNDSSWSFDDFVTPQKPTASRKLHRTQDVRHWGTEENAPTESPLKMHQQIIKPRKDAEAHFEFVDDGVPAGEPRAAGRPRGATHNEGLGLYENNLYSEDGKQSTSPAPVLGNITNLKDRTKDFQPHFQMSDDSPHGSTNGSNGADAAKPVGEDRKKAVRMMESNWAAYDESPASQKENNRPVGGTGITIAGDGMGSRKVVSGNRSGGVAAERGITIAGDGMGGRKTTGGRGWAIGDESDEEEAATKAAAVPGKAQRGAQKSSFWDF